MSAYVELCLVVHCRDCDKKTHHSLPVDPGHTLRCACGSKLAVDPETLDRVEALEARFRASLRGDFAPISRGLNANGLPI